MTSEKSLVLVENNAVEDPVRIILSKLKNFQTREQNLVLHGVFFETTASSLRDPTDGKDKDRLNRDEKLRTDQICVFRSDGSPRDSRNGSDKSKIAYVIEYKAPHKLHTKHLEQGLRKISIIDEVVNKPTIPKADPAKFQHYSDLLTAAAVTQTYHYMVEAGLEYGYLTNGDAIVFLKIDWADPTVLYYHLAQPSREVAVNEDPIYSNAVCQVLAFTLLALQTTPHRNDERSAAIKNCKKWVVDFDAMLDKIICEEEEEASKADPSTPKGKKKHRRVPSSPGYNPKPIKKTKRGPKQQSDSGQDRVLRSHSKRGGPGGGDPGAEGGGATAPASQQGESSRGQGGASSSTPSSHGSSSSRSSGSDGGGDGRSRQGRPYCTPSCLLSLVNGWPLDMQCPNVLLHTQAAAGDNTRGRTHPVSHTEWMVLLRQQLSQSLEKGVVVLGQEGASGALFQLTLLQYGYTFVAKGVTGRCVPVLHKEEAVYGKLQPLQGRHIPVCLGSVDLRQLDQIYYYDFDVRIIYFLLLSYGGTKLAVPEDPKERARIVDSVTAVLDQMHRLGVAHADIRLPNVLQGPAPGQLTIIDFDRASILPTASRSAMSAISSNKRRRLMDDDDTFSSSVTLDKSAESVLYREAARQDKSNAQCLFTMDGGRLIFPKRKEGV